MTPIERLANILKTNNLQQKSLAEYVDISTSTLNNWIQNNREIPSSKLIPICKFIGVSIPYLLTGEEDMTENGFLPLDEQKLLDKYRLLDESGKEYIYATLVCELRRVEREKPLGVISAGEKGQGKNMVSAQKDTSAVGRKKHPPGTKPDDKKQA